MAALLLHQSLNLFPISHDKSQPFHRNRTRTRTIHVLHSSKPIEKSNYTPGVFDPVFLNLFRNKMVQEVGWDSEKPGYDGLIDVANRLMLARTNSQTQEAAVRILRSLFPPLLLELYKILIAPIAQGKLAALMVGEFFFSFSFALLCFAFVNCYIFQHVLCCECEARVTALSCQWLMGSCTVNSVDGSSLPTGVFVERCKYLEESKCVGICINTCKLPTQEFFMDYMGVPLLMEPNFNDYSCQFKFGVLPPQQDATLKEPCLEVCPHKNEIKCPKA
ncbi:beta-carotene isomerase D27, chloroplastic isoform X1 [Cynara cardunculus var. scolymus]|uniref:beta-carotene isomerase D27, chloroplastic isoform X1 n=1 Tax=Cynara cardunculus var. scolymus TaxID=59895 RepID=UPI000D624697|nr:beta-carotene isomerase D27, chloroplastic isoform X1 [Cynara cardunculus var. scolymus]